MQSIGVIGLGNMGSALAKNLLRAGFPVVAYDIRESAIDALVAEGAQKADSPAQTRGGQLRGHQHGVWSQ